jgi:hypothetical protein
MSITFRYQRHSPDTPRRHRVTSLGMAQITAPRLSQESCRRHLVFIHRDNTKEDHDFST